MDHRHFNRDKGEYTANPLDKPHAEVMVIQVILTSLSPPPRRPSLPFPSLPFPSLSQRDHHMLRAPDSNHHVYGCRTTRATTAHPATTAVDAPLRQSSTFGSPLPACIPFSSRAVSNTLVLTCECLSLTLRLFYGCSDMFRLSGNNRRDSHFTGS